MDFLICFKCNLLNSKATFCRGAGFDISCEISTYVSGYCASYVRMFYYAKLLYVILFIWWGQLGGLENDMLSDACGLGQHFEARGHSFSLYRPSKPANNTFIFFPAINWPTSGFVYATLFGLCAAFKAFAIKIWQANERVTQILDKKRCNKEQIDFELLYVSCI